MPPEPPLRDTNEPLFRAEGEARFLYKWAHLATKSIDYPLEIHMHFLGIDSSKRQ